MTTLDLSDLKKELEKKETQIANIPQSILDSKNFTYINFTGASETDRFLNEKSFTILNSIAITNISLGNIFIEVQNYLKEKEDTYTEWLESIGFNRMTALRYKKRAEFYNLVQSKKAKDFISTLPQRLIDELSKLENKEETIEYLDMMNDIKDLDWLLKADNEKLEYSQNKTISLKDKIKRLPLNNFKNLSVDKKAKIDILLEEIEKILKEEKS